MILGKETALLLLETAKASASKAYAPYSQLTVGAALLKLSGKIITGVNIENASYSLTICAERCAIFNAVSQGYRDFIAIAVWAKLREHGAITPCGACLQVLSEFMMPDAVIVTADPSTGKLRQTTLESLLPKAFAI